ncbi:hypothetical protein HB364_14050 [Pseudoflavitalea sp. X16]|uniref:hypothetical protein n=1 Tax=Paraflavitalea devenefica TaxID=2716334 RepID=UPI001423B99B|nr:hypothetical protein [Paraflavitalea devenefica]NII26212.1 hypothetical protein [Paraflavitalea devenefica]
MKPSMQIISLGLGVQSVALYYMSSMRLLPVADYAIVADTGREKSSTYAYLNHLLQWQQKNAGIPIIVKKDKNLFTDLLNQNNSHGNRFSSIPSYTRNSDGTTGMLRRQCTNEYKIQVVDNAIRDLYGLGKYQRRPQTFVWKGISMDEVERMDQPRSSWKTNVYPFTGFEFDREGWRRILWMPPMDRNQIISWYVHQNLPVPEKSACVFCPYQSDAGWAKMKRDAPDDFADAIRIDNAIRNSTTKGIQNPCYLHKSLKPLDQINFTSTDELWSGECTGNCHT